ncbi:reverse transcriptase domain-containing protein [Tanacetum coccineum]
MSYIPDVPIVMQRSSFMSNSKCPELARRFSNQVPRTMTEMMKRVDDFVKSKEVFKNMELPKGEHPERGTATPFKGSRPPLHPYESEPSRGDAYNYRDHYQPYVPPRAPDRRYGNRRHDHRRQEVNHPLTKNLNAACPKDYYPLQEIDLKIEAVMGHPFKCFLDAYKRNHQIQMSKVDEEKTNFYTDQGTYCYVKMPFGLKNAGATYQRLVDSAFQTQLGRNLEAYIDYMVIKSKSEQDMITDIAETFDKLRRINMKLNPTKCSFGVGEGKFLGYMVTSEGIRVNPKKTKAIADMQSPKTLKEMQSLSGKLAALNRFLSRSAEQSLPFFETLKNITKENKDYWWTEETEHAFQ